MFSLAHVPKSPYERAWNGALVARLNVLYHQRVLSFYESWDKALRIVALLLSSLGVGLAIKYGPDWAAVAAGGGSAAISAWSLVMQLPEKARAAGSLLPLYVKHYAVLSRLVMKGEDVDVASVDAALAALDETQIIEAEKIKVADDKLRREAQKILHEEIGAPPPGSAVSAIVAAGA